MRDPRLTRTSATRRRKPFPSRLPQQRKRRLDSIHTNRKKTKKTMGRIRTYGHGGYGRSTMHEENWDSFHRKYASAEYRHKYYEQYREPKPNVFQRIAACWRRRQRRRAVRGRAVSVQQQSRKYMGIHRSGSGSMNDAQLQLCHVWWGEVAFLSSP